MQTPAPLVKLFTLACTALLFAGNSFSQVAKQKIAKQPVQYVCTPCGHDCDKEVFSQPGKCPSCQMSLVKKSSVTFKTIQPSKVCAYVKEHPNVVLLDVRTKEEFEGKANPDFGTLKNAVNIPIQELEQHLSSISTLKNKDIIVYCSHSHRSPQASYILTQNGFTKITNMAGGMSVMTDNSCKK